MNLTEVRAQIDVIDEQMRELFVKRMALSGQVALAKAETGDLIYKQDREDSIITTQGNKVDASIRREYIAFIKAVMAISREYQYKRTLELRNADSDSILQIPNSSADTNDNSVTIRFQCKNQSGALAGILTVIGNYGINILSFQVEASVSSPCGYTFYATLDANPGAKDSQAMLLQLQCESIDFQVIRPN